MLVRGRVDGKSLRRWHGHVTQHEIELFRRNLPRRFAVGDPAEEDDDDEYLDECNGHFGPYGDYHYHITSVIQARLEPFGPRRPLDMISHPQVNPNDYELLERWRDKDEDAGRKLFLRHFESVYRFFRNKVGDAAEDLTQQTFMGCVQGKAAFRGDASFRTYLFTIARNRLYAFLRERERSQNLFENASTSIADLGLLSPSGIVAAHEEQRLLLRALRRLPIDQQIALELFYWEDLSIPEISAVLDTPVPTVKRRLQLARQRLDTIIAELSESELLRRSTVDNFEAWARDLQRVLRPEQHEP